MHGLIKATCSDTSLHAKVAEFHIFTDSLFEEMNLINLQIFSALPLKTQTSLPDLQTKREVSQQSKKLEKMEKELLKMKREKSITKPGQSQFNIPQ